MKICRCKVFKCEYIKKNRRKTSETLLAVLIDFENVLCDCNCVKKNAVYRFEFQSSVNCFRSNTSIYRSRLLKFFELEFLIYEFFKVKRRFCASVIFFLSFSFKQINDWQSQKIRKKF